MKLSCHWGLEPEPGPVGILVVDEAGFDYVPRSGAFRGLKFTKTLLRAVDGGARPNEILVWFAKHGGPTRHGALSFYSHVDATSRIEAIRSHAEAQGWRMDWEQGFGATASAPSNGTSHVASDEMPELPRSLKQAMVFQTLTLLYRRHGQRLDLRLFEAHPGGGMYDCLGLSTDAPSVLCMFNIEGSSLVVHEMGPPNPPADPPPWWSFGQWRYPRAFYAYGGAAGLADQLVRRLGLSERRLNETSTATSISIAVLAELAKRHALSDNAPHFRSGFCDTSGMASSAVRSWVAQIPTIQARCDAAGHGTYEAARLANRLWGVCDATNSSPHAVVDLGNGRVYVDGEEAGSLWSRYVEGAGIRELAWCLEGLWRG